MLFFPGTSTISPEWEILQRPGAPQRNGYKGGCIFSTILSSPAEISKQWKMTQAWEEGTQTKHKHRYPKAQKKLWRSISCIQFTIIGILDFSSVVFSPKISFIFQEGNILTVFKAIFYTNWLVLFLFLLFNILFHCICLITAVLQFASGLTKILYL